jgi:acetyl esterase/lipase
MKESNMEFFARIDPELSDGLALWEALGFAEQDLAGDRITALRERAAHVLAALVAELPPNDRVLREDRSVPGPRGDVPIRIYRPVAAEAPLPCLAWIHGGGMIFGSVDADDLACDRYAEAVGCVVISVDYRLAPEHPHPAPVEDCYAALRWAAENAGELGIDPGRIALGGSSAGGGLAAGTALLARDRGGPPVVFQLLVYPMLDDRDGTPSTAEFDAILTWSRRHNRSGWAALLGDRAGTADVDQYAAPARATDLSGLPPALIQVGELEVFRDEDIDYATRLLAAGVPTQLHVYPGAYHAWDAVAPGAAASFRALQERVEALSRALHPGESTYTAVTSPPLGLNVAPM